MKNEERVRRLSRRILKHKDEELRASTIRVANAHVLAAGLIAPKLARAVLEMLEKEEK